MNRPMMCRSCKKLMGVADNCPWCGTARPGKTSEFFSRFAPNLLSPHMSVGEIIIKISIAFFIVELLAVLLLGGFSAFIKSIWSVPGGVIDLLGASSPELFNGRWWGPLTASWLHGGGLHILFNMMAVRQITDFIEQTTTRSFTWTAYILTGAGGFALSALAGHFSCGASASIFGLIGLGMAIAFLLGNGADDPMFKALLSWAAMGLLFGFLFPGIDNTAHLGGLLTGGILGLIWSTWRSKKWFHWVLPKLVVGLWGLTIIGFLYSILNKLQII
ncbi:MAG: rhomboid family intramembrane serine protease [Pseudomonadota bacterium]